MFGGFTGAFGDKEVVFFARYGGMVEKREVKLWWRERELVTMVLNEEVESASLAVGWCGGAWF